MLNIQYIKMIVNRASKICGLVGTVNELCFGCCCAQSAYWHLLYENETATRSPHHSVNQRQRSIYYMWSCKYGNWSVIWLWLCITDVLAAFIGKRDINKVTAPFREWASTEHQWCLALHLGLFVFRLVADIHLWDIGSLRGQNQQQHAPCCILKMSVNGASTVLGIANFVMKASRGSSCT